MSSASRRGSGDRLCDACHPLAQPGWNRSPRGYPRSASPGILRCLRSRQRGRFFTRPMATGNIADRHARLQHLVDDQHLLLRRKPPPAATPVMTSTLPSLGLGLAPPLTPGSGQNRGSSVRQWRVFRIMQLNVIMDLMCFGWMQQMRAFVQIEHDKYLNRLSS